jgi:hypothetical protein
MAYLQNVGALYLIFVTLLLSPAETGARHVYNVKVRMRTEMAPPV